ncbi:MAG: hypothetical protein Q7T66_04910 [Herminiimonas sp.]|uniref:hypothetical protein n=1 Tax=Herminiimonas sp. TaxID=1926289 RepID=UPI002722296A|nr:hypothetical protein [Herminiimonas sp.]MDO9419986.1 hypothetical protein [Herminiimonas sp.]
MKDWIDDVLMILAYSRKTQLAFMLGVVGFLVILLTGWYQLENFQLQGMMAPYSDFFRDKILRKYDKAAWFCLISFWILAFKMYQKDKKRFYKFY